MPVELRLGRKSSGRGRSSDSREGGGASSSTPVPPGTPASRGPGPVAAAASPGPPRRPRLRRWVCSSTAFSTPAAALASAGSAFAGAGRWAVAAPLRTPVCGRPAGAGRRGRAGRSRGGRGAAASRGAGGPRSCGTACPPRRRGRAGWPRAPSRRPRGWSAQRGPVRVGRTPWSKPATDPPRAPVRSPIAGQPASTPDAVGQAQHVQRGNAATPGRWRCRCPTPRARCDGRTLGRLGTVVDDVGQVHDIQPPRREIRGHQVLDPAVAHGGHHAIALLLVQLAADQVHREASLAQVPGQDLGVIPRVAEDEGVLGTLGLQDPHEIPQPVGGIDEEHLVADLRGRDPVLGQRDQRRVAQEALGQPQDVGWQRGRHEDPLVAAREALHDRLDVRLEAHGQELVGLVQNEDAQRLEHLGHPVEDVQDAPGRPHDPVHAASQGFHLRLDGNPAVQERDLQTALAADAAQLARDLGRQLPRGCQDEEARSLGRRREALDQRQTVGQRLARSGSGLDERVPACPQRLEAGALHGQRHMETRLVQRVQGRGRKRKRFKTRRRRELRGFVCVDVRHAAAVYQRIRGNSTGPCLPSRQRAPSPGFRLASVRGRGAQV